MNYSERGILALARAISASFNTFRVKAFCFTTLENGIRKEHPDFRIVTPPLITGEWQNEIVVFTASSSSGQQTFVWRARPQHETDDEEIIGVRLPEAANV